MRFRYQRWLIRTAFLYILVGIVLGTGMFLGYRFPSFAPLLALRVVHTHLILVGGVIQLIMGVGLWFFPPRTREPRFPSEQQGMGLYFLFNIGVLLRAFFEVPGRTLPWAFWIAFVGVLLQAGALCYFAYLVWGRIRPPSPPTS